jgi:hypothetical protein
MKKGLFSQAHRDKDEHSVFGCFSLLFCVRSRTRKRNIDGENKEEEEKGIPALPRKARGVETWPAGARAQRVSGTYFTRTAQHKVAKSRCGTLALFCSVLPLDPDR